METNSPISNTGVGTATMQMASWNTYLRREMKCGVNFPECLRRLSMNAIEIVKEAYLLAWQKSEVVGMGVLQDHPTATRDEVWACVNKNQFNAGRQEFFADYLFGRMMKLRCILHADGRIEHSSLAHSDFQSWAKHYKNHENLFNEARKNVTAQS